MNQSFKSTYTSRTQCLESVLDEVNKIVEDLDTLDLSFLD